MLVNAAKSLKLPVMSNKSSGSLERAQRAQAIANVLSETYPDATCELDFSNPLELTVATILSAQCTDVRVNQVTPELFSNYQDARDYAYANPEDIARIIAPTGFQNRKTQQLIKLGQALEDKYAGEVPQAMEDLTSLPGVGRKTANVVRSNAFGLPGISVDTHFGRLTRRWGLTQAEKPEVVEAEIAKLLPQSEWTNFSHRTIIHGRRVCTARKPKCGHCVLAQLCPSYEPAR